VSKSVADLVNEAMARKRRPDGRPWGPYQLMGAIGLLEGDRPFNITQVQRLLSGERRSFSRRLIARLIEVLDFTEEEQDELWHAAELWPGDLDLDTYRRLKLLAAMPASELTARYVGQTALPVPAELQDAALLRRLGVPNLERRRAERRRRPRLVPQMEQVAA